MKIKDLYNDRLLLKDELKEKEKEIVNKATSNESLKVEIINFLIDEEDYYFSSCDFKKGNITNFKDMDNGTYITSKTDREGNWGFETTYLLEEAILDNLDYIYPIIEKYEN